MRKLLLTSVTDTAIVISLIVWLMSLAAVRDSHTWQSGNVFAPLVAPMAIWQVSAGLYLMPLLFVGLVIVRFKSSMRTRH